MADHVGREPEQIPAEHRRPRRAGDPANEQERSERRQRRHQQSGEVVGDHRSIARRQWSGNQARQRHAGDPRKVNALGRPDDPRMERVKVLRNRVRPPLKTPDEDLRVAPIARMNLGQSENHPPPIEEN